MTKETRIADPPLITADQLAKWELDNLERLRRGHITVHYDIVTYSDGSTGIEFPTGETILSRQEKNNDE